MMYKHNYKLLITAGCSFSQVPNRDITWPVHLKSRLDNIETLFLGQGAAGNGIISRKVIYHTLEALKKYKPEEILVGIMWSGRDRFEIFSENEIPHNEINTGPGIDHYRNPVKVAGNYNFYLLNTHWDDHSTKTYIKNFYDEAGAFLLTIEHILRTQWFLKQYNINYFMTEYSFDCLPREEKIIYNPDINYLYDQVDKSYFLKINNCFEWARDRSGFNFARPPDPHPSTDQNSALTDAVIMPHLVAKNYIELVKT